MNLYYKFVFFIKEKKKIASLLKRKKIFLDLGSSGENKKKYIGIDITKGSDLQWDITKGIPFKDNTVEEIVSNHFFEHLNIDNLLFVLSECHRVLKKGGKLDFTVPHINPYLDAYIKKDIDFLKEKIRDIPDKYKDIYNTPFDIMMWLIYRNGEHKTFFDRDSIISKVKYVGFLNVKTRKFDKTKDTNKRYSSIYVTAIK